MSSNRRTRSALEAWFVFVVMLLTTWWYASHQLVNSLYFSYQLARAVFPGLVPNVGLP
jgi:hypothetical protein